jgi:tetratricopeptide (TPR) repeat protein
MLVVVVAGLVQLLSPSQREAVAEEAANLPVPPFPPRIAEGDAYESCLATLANDPISAVSIAEAWQASGGGDAALHCRGLALIAVGKPAEGAALLEQLAASGNAAPLALASVLGQAGQARLMVAQADKAAEDTTKALRLSPDNADLLLMRATALSAGGKRAEAVDDTSAALRIDGQRIGALVQRAVLRRELGQLDLAQADIDRAMALDPDDADALLERGILRQRMGNIAGARADWERVRIVNPDSTTADLAAQDLSLLEAGPAR